jgi:hypothetical protein
VHGYGTPEQERLVAQAEHWRHRLIRDGTTLEPGTRVLEVGCGVGAVLAVLGQEFPGAELTGVDIERNSSSSRAATWSGRASRRGWCRPTAMVQGMAASGWSDAGTRLPGWLREAGFDEVDDGERAFWWQGDDLTVQANYAADVLESALDALA